MKNEEFSYCRSPKTTSRKHNIEIDSLCACSSYNNNLNEKPIKQPLPTPKGTAYDHGEPRRCRKNDKQDKPAKPGKAHKYHQSPSGVLLPGSITVPIPRILRYSLTSIENYVEGEHSGHNGHTSDDYPKIHNQSVQVKASHQAQSAQSYKRSKKDGYCDVCIDRPTSGWNTGPKHEPHLKDKTAGSPKRIPKKAIHESPAKFTQSSPQKCYQPSETIKSKKTSCQSLGDSSISVIYCPHCKGKDQCQVCKGSSFQKNQNRYRPNIRDTIKSCPGRKRNCKNHQAVPIHSKCQKYEEPCRGQCTRKVHSPYEEQVQEYTDEVDKCSRKVIRSQPRKKVEVPAVESCTICNHEPCWIDLYVDDVPTYCCPDWYILGRRDCPDSLPQSRFTTCRPVSMGFPRVPLANRKIQKVDRSYRSQQRTCDEEL